MGVGTLGYLLPYPSDMQAEGWIATAPPASGPTTAVTPLSQNYATTANLGLAAGMHNFTECYIILTLLQTLSALSTSQCVCLWTLTDFEFSKTEPVPYLARFFSGRDTQKSLSWRRGEIWMITLELNNWSCSEQMRKGKVWVTLCALEYWPVRSGFTLSPFPHHVWREWVEVIFLVSWKIPAEARRINR